MRKSRLNKSKQDKLLEYFVLGSSTARVAASLAGVNKNTASYYFHRLREVIFICTEQMTWEYFKGDIEVDESYFVGKRKWKHDCGASGKIPVFGLLKRGGKGFTKIIGDAKLETLLPIICEKVVPDSIVYTDAFRSYNMLDVSEVQALPHH